MAERMLTHDPAITNEALAEEILYYLYDLSDRLDGRPTPWSLADRCEMGRIHLHAEELYNRFATERTTEHVIPIPTKPSKKATRLRRQDQP